MDCPRCGHSNPAGADRCAGCGAPFGDESIAPTRLTPPPAGEPPRRPKDSISTPTVMSGPPPGGSSRPGDSISTPTVMSGPPAGAEPGGGDPLDQLEPGRILAGRYEVGTMLGRGGMGVVYRARDLTLERDVALKVIRPDMVRHPEIMERFRREILLASKVTHKNILRIHDLVESDGLSYISMNFVEGENLEDRMERDGPPALEATLGIATQVARALEAAHEAGVVHRDLKPQNILLDGDGIAYIADFGLSRSLEPGKTMTEAGMILGTLEYMSPEQARGDTHDHRGDIYAFGLILYEMLTGKPPFQTGNAMSSMLKRVHEEAPKVTSIRRGVPKWLESIIKRCLKKDPAARYQSVTGLLHDLERRRASWALRQMFRPKNLLRTATTLGAVAVLAVAVVVGVRLLTRDRAAAVIAPKASLAVLPFGNATGDPAFDWTRTGLPNLIHTDLTQTKALRLIAEERVQSILGGLQLGSEGEYRNDAVQRVSGLLGVDHILTGKLMKAGNTFRIEASIQTAGGATVTAGEPIQVEGAGEDALFAMVDDLTDRVREDLGVTGGWGEKDLGVTELSTDSIAALGLYEQGLARVRAGNDTEGATVLEQAVATDPEFAVARALLAETYDRLGFADKAKTEAGEAMRNLAQASPYEAARVRTVYARIEGDREQAEASARALVDMSPNNAAALLDLGSALEENGKLEDAFASIQKAVELDPQNPEALYAIGRVKVMMGNAAAALPDFQSALALHQNTGNDEGRGKVLNGLGFALDDLGRGEEALQRFEEANQIHKGVGDRRGAGMALNNIAAVLMNMGRFDEAIEKENEALKLGHEIGDDVSLGIWYSNLGDIYQGAGQPTKALEAYQKSLRYARDSNNETVLAWNLSSLGFLNAALGKYLEAGIFLKDALEKVRELGNKAEIMAALNDLAGVELIQGRYEEALSYYLEAIDMAREMDNPIALANLQVNIALIQQDQGDFAAAIGSLAAAEKTARDLQADDLLSSMLTYQGKVCSRLGDSSGASRALDEAGMIAENLGNLELIADIGTIRSMLHRMAGRWEQADSEAQAALQAAETSGNHRLILIARLRLAEARRSPEQLAQVAAELDSTGLLPSWTAAQLSLARVQVDAGNLSAAERSVAAGLGSAEELGQQDLEFHFHHLAGRIALAGENREAAADHFSAALEILDSFVEKLDPPSRLSFLARSDTGAFLDAATSLFEALEKTAESDQLKALLAP